MGSKILPGFVSVLLSLLILTGCEQQSRKTDSQLFRERIEREANVAVAKAQTHLKAAQSSPMENLDTLILVQKALREAASVYRKNNIENWHNADIEAIEQKMSAIRGELADASVPLLLELHNRTRLLRAEIEQAKTRPFSAGERSTDELVKFLASEYNEDIDTCCLVKLGQVAILLRGDSDYRALRTLLLTINRELERMLKEASYGEELKQTILSFR